MLPDRWLLKKFAAQSQPMRMFSLWGWLCTRMFHLVNGLNRWLCLPPLKLKAIGYNFRFKFLVMRKHFIWARHQSKCLQSQNLWGSVAELWAEGQSRLLRLLLCDFFYEDMPWEDTDHWPKKLHSILSQWTSKFIVLLKGVWMRGYLCEYAWQLYSRNIHPSMDNDSLKLYSWVFVGAAQ